MIFLVVYFRRRDVYDLHHAILGDKSYASLLGYLVKTLGVQLTEEKSIGQFFYGSILRQFDDLKKYLLCAGLLFSVLVTAVITDAIKNAVGRPRPDFFWRCFPDGKDVCLLQFLCTSF